MSINSALASDARLLLCESSEEVSTLHNKPDISLSLQM